MNAICEVGRWGEHRNIPVLQFPLRGAFSPHPQPLPSSSVLFRLLVHARRNQNSNNPLEWRQIFWRERDGEISDIENVRVEEEKMLWTSPWFVWEISRRNFRNSSACQQLSAMYLIISVFRENKGHFDKNSARLL